MRFEKSPPWLVDLFDELIAGTPGERRQMFGCPCGFLNGQLFCGLFGSSLFVRLSEQERTGLLAISGARVFDPMGGRPMKEYVVVPEPLLEDPPALGRWLDLASSYALSLPPKAAKRSSKATRRPAKATRRPAKATRRPAKAAKKSAKATKRSAKKVSAR